MSDDASATSGTEPDSGSFSHSVPKIVLLVVKWTYAASGSIRISEGSGTREKFSDSVDPAICTVPTFCASLTAFFDHEPVTM